jgi:hypothetical protein
VYSRSPSGPELAQGTRVDDSDLAGATEAHIQPMLGSVEGEPHRPRRRRSEDADAGERAVGTRVADTDLGGKLSADICPLAIRAEHDVARRFARRDRGCHALRGDVDDVDAVVGFAADIDEAPVGREAHALRL